MRSLVRALPLIALLLTLQVYTPEWESSTSVGMLGLTLTGVYAVVMYWLLSKLSFKATSYVFVLGLVPDIVFSLISAHLMGDWSWEGNAWVGTTECIWIIIPFTLCMWGGAYLIRDTRAGKIFMLWFALLRAIAVFSHPVLWAYL
jgi:hypothetical protein